MEGGRRRTRGRVDGTTSWLGCSGLSVDHGSHGRGDATFQSFCRGCRREWRIGVEAHRFSDANVRFAHAASCFSECCSEQAGSCRTSGLSGESGTQYRRSRDSPAGDDRDRVHGCWGTSCACTPQGLSIGGLPASHHGGRRRVHAQRRHWHRSAAACHATTSRRVASGRPLRDRWRATNEQSCV
jgi:hypothetical protein